MSEFCLVQCTAPDESVAQVLARGAVEQRLAACVNIVPGLRSIYRWKNAIEEDSELLLLIKTTRSKLARLQAWLVQEHPYENPEVIAVDITHGSNAYLEWIGEST